MARRMPSSLALMVSLLVASLLVLQIQGAPVLLENKAARSFTEVSRSVLNVVDPLKRAITAAPHERRRILGDPEQLTKRVRPGLTINTAPKPGANSGAPRPASAPAALGIPNNSPVTSSSSTVGGSPSPPGPNNSPVTSESSTVHSTPTTAGSLPPANALDPFLQLTNSAAPSKTDTVVSTADHSSPATPPISPISSTGATDGSAPPDSDSGSSSSTSPAPGSPLSSPQVPPPDLE